MFWNLASFIYFSLQTTRLTKWIDGSPRQKIQDLDGNMPRPKIRACSICDPYVLVFREDDSIGLFIDTERGKIRRKDMSPMGDKVRYFLFHIRPIANIFRMFPDLTLCSRLFLY